jgi:thiol-disulfide isomerase/thioredoxin
MATMNFSHHLIRSAAAASMLWVAGCAEQSTSNRSESSAPPSSSIDAEDSPSTGDEIQLQTVDRARFDRVLASHKGKVVFVDYWATWCGNCMEEFPHTVALHEKYAADGLAVVSLAMEFDPDDTATRQRAWEFLKSQNARFDNLYADSPDALEQYGIDVLPHYRLYDRTGKLHREFTFSDPDNPISQADIEAAVRELLASEPMDIQK